MTANKFEKGLSEIKLKRLKGILQSLGHYATIFQGNIILNSMQSITFKDLNYIVTDDQTGEYKTFGTESDVVAYLNETGDTTTMPELQRPIQRESNISDDIKREFEAAKVANDIKFGLELVKLRQALEFYADPVNYEADVVSQWMPVVPVGQDAGKIARQALGKGELL